MTFINERSQSNNEIERGKNTISEIYSQPEAWEKAILEVENKKHEISSLLSQKNRQIIFTGCGSTYYLSIAAAVLFQKFSNSSCRAIPAGELFMSPNTYFPGGDCILIAVSRSGSTTETIEAVDNFKKINGGTVIALTNYEDSPLAIKSDLVISIKEGQEKSIAQTKSFSSMFVAATALTQVANNNHVLLEEMKRLPEICNHLINKYHDFSKEIGNNLSFDRFYYLGSGPRYGIACEANLKMKEMALTHTEPFHFLEFRHGPKSMVTQNTGLFGLLSFSNKNYEEKVLTEMKAIGAYSISLGEKGGDVSFESGLDEDISTILYLPVLQLIAYYRSIAKGLDPDRPKNLSAVIQL